MFKWAVLIAVLALGGSLFFTGNISEADLKGFNTEPVTSYLAENNVLMVNGVHAVQEHYDQSWSVVISKHVVYYGTFGKYHLEYAPIVKLRAMAQSQKEARVSVTVQAEPNDEGILFRTDSFADCVMQDVPATGDIPCEGTHATKSMHFKNMDVYAVVDTEGSPSTLHIATSYKPAPFIALVHIYFYAIWFCGALFLASIMSRSCT